VLPQFIEPEQFIVTHTQTQVKTVKPAAVIDIGATSIRMAVAEISEQGDVRMIEPPLSQAVSIGRDTFTRGSIHRSTIEDCVRVLKIYQHKLLEYQIEPGHIRVVATSAVREASNRLAFLDRIYIGAGLKVEPLDEAEVTRLTYLGVQPHLQAEATFAQAQTVVLEVGGGSTEALLVREGNVEFSHTFRLGSLRMRRSLETHQAPAARFQRMLQPQIERAASHIRQQAPPAMPLEMIALGGDVRHAALEIDSHWQQQDLCRLPVAKLREYTDGIVTMSVDELVHQRKLSFSAAETIGPALLAYTRLAECFELKHVYISSVNLRDGLLKQMATSGAWSVDFRKQVIRSAMKLAVKFDSDQSHSRHVAQVSTDLFNELQSQHQLGPRYETILHVAAILHEIGLYISNRGYHKHTMYLIRNSELFGLGKTDMLLVALVARYHRRASPQPNHDGYATLDRDDRVAVAKMAAILRLAVALDESRSQRVATVECKKRGRDIVITTPGIGDLSLEQVAMNQNGSLFEEVYGLRVVLRPQPR